MSVFYEFSNLSNLHHYLAMKTLYYSLKKASQLAGVSQERICEWEQDESNELAPARNNSGAFLFNWDDIKVIKELKEKMSLKKDVLPATNEAEQDNEKKSLYKPITADASILPKHDGSLTFAKPPFRAASSGKIEEAPSRYKSVPDSDREELIKTAEELGGLAREALQFQNQMDDRKMELKVRPAFPDIHLASYPRNLSPGGLRFTRDESTFNKDLNEIREILQELHDRL